MQNYAFMEHGSIKHFMTGPTGNSEFCFPETSMFRVEVIQNSVFPMGPVIKGLVIPPNSNIEKQNTAKKSFGVKEHDLITCESKVEEGTSEF